MFAAHLSTAVAHASLDGCDALARDLWRAYAGGALDDDATEAVAAALAERRLALRGRGAPEPIWSAKPLHGAPTRFPPRRVQVSPDRARSRERRRRLAASGPMPPALAAKFTTGELAVLRIVADEVAERGRCDRSYAELAARAGTCRTLARRAIRIAARLGLLTIEERPRPGRKHLTNVVRIVDAAWLGWIGGTKDHPTGIRSRNKGGEDIVADRNNAPIRTVANASNPPIRVSADTFENRLRRTSSL